MSAYLHMLRLEGLLATKARSRTEVELSRKLQRVFNQAKRKMVSKLQRSAALGIVERRILLNELDILVDEAGQLVYRSVLEAAEQEPGIKEILQQSSFDASARTIARMKGDVLGTLEQAWTAGLGTADAAAMLDEVFVGMERYEAERIARTEVNSAQSTGRFTKMQAAGVKYVQWWTARDSRVRNTHKGLHGLITVLGNRFPNGLKHPGDKSGPLVEWINCRCRPLPFIMPITLAPPAGKIWFKESELLKAA